MVNTFLFSRCSTCVDAVNAAAEPRTEIRTSSHFEYICVKWKLDEVVFKINNTYE